MMIAVFIFKKKRQGEHLKTHNNTKKKKINTNNISFQGYRKKLNQNMLCSLHSNK